MLNRNKETNTVATEKRPLDIAYIKLESWNTYKQDAWCRFVFRCADELTDEQILAGQTEHMDIHVKVDSPEFGQFSALQQDDMVRIVGVFSGTNGTSAGVYLNRVDSVKVVEADHPFRVPAINGMRARQEEAPEIGKSAAPNA